MSGTADLFDLVAGEVCLDFVNNRHRWRQAAGDPYEGLVAWGVAAGLLDESAARGLCLAREECPHGEADHVCDRGDRLAEALKEIFTAVSTHLEVVPEALTSLNEELSTALQNARVGDRDGCYLWGWREDPIALDRPLWPVARNAAELLTSDRLGLVKICTAESCDWLLLDSSRNHSRRWCDMQTCGNRQKVRRFRARQG